MADFFDDLDKAPERIEPTRTNAPPEYSVSELSHKLKSFVEDEFSFVRVRGEISKVTVAKSGHLYTSLKDESSVLDAICWKGTVSRLSIKPEEGMEVICTGKLTTYPGRSNYQMIIETMELAGQGALLKMLEDRKKKLALEGLFDVARKKKLPFLPRTIGVVTSPTGAVIRDIMHRLNDRFPTRVLLWPVLVQGVGAAAQVTEAVKGFNAIDPTSPHYPDLIIVARGGGSLEDLMPFNDEMVVRAVAESHIPLISAVGHETDTTLIDFASDHRAPTPTAAAERAVPVRADLIANLIDYQKRFQVSTSRIIINNKTHLAALARGLGSPKRLFEQAVQRMDYLSTRLDSSLLTWLDKRRSFLKDFSNRLTPERFNQRIASHIALLKNNNERLKNTENALIKKRREKVDYLSNMLQSLSFERVLERGYAVIFDENKNIVSSSKNIAKGASLTIKLKDGEVKSEVKK